LRRLLAFGGRGLQRYRELIDDFDPKSFQRNYFARVIGEQPYRVESQIREYLRADPMFVL
jgi:hypothetical protein